ncbi:DNA topoisomerase I [Staphylococcus phage Twort]|uniref:DNA topoisomerase I n=2 Tax=Staphylococcus phage Twort (strain DSM 17442 / HER 48) TaxID=2908167 RepID=A0A6H0X5I2_BPTWO|nr:ORF138 [Staphylococcus phage Twort]AAX92424.1 ORF138 [Staphylococcus phage Twort]QIW89097.1 DNA topoisomerase I [Staphylococcus phage Twort]
MLHYHKPNLTIATIHGEITVDENGKVSGLTKTQEKDFKDVVGYTYAEDKKPQPKKEEPKEENKEEVKTEPKKKTTRKTTRKTTTKKDEE